MTNEEETIQQEVQDEVLMTVSDCVIKLFASFGQSSNSQRIAIYTLALNALPVPVLAASCKKLIMENEFLPSIAEIIQVSRDLIAKANHIDVKSWDEAWKELRSERLRAGIYEKPVFSRPEIEETVKSFGWRDFCVAPEKDERIVHAQMKKIYESVCNREKIKDIDNYVLYGTNILVSLTEKMALPEAKRNAKSKELDRSFEASYERALAIVNRHP